jgi:hypothetical protein
MLKAVGGYNNTVEHLETKDALLLFPDGRHWGTKLPPTDASAKGL